MRKRLKKICVYALIISIVFLPGFVKYFSLRRQMQQNRVRLQALVEENKRLTEENRRLKEDPVYIEKMVRDNLGLVKKGEYVVKLKNQENSK